LQEKLELLRVFRGLMGIEPIPETRSKEDFE